MLDAMPYWENGTLETFLGADPFNHLVEGISIFRRALASVREADRAAEEAEREKNRR